MSLIININSLSYLYDYLDLGVHDFIVGTNQFSCRQALTVDYIELKEIKEKYPMIRLFVLVNALVEQKYLDDLKNVMATVQKQSHDLLTKIDKALEKQMSKVVEKNPLQVEIDNIKLPVTETPQPEKTEGAIQKLNQGF